MTAVAKFLTEVDRYSVDLPDGMDPTPDLRSVVTLDGGARSIVFQPFARAFDPAKSRDFRHLYDIRQGVWTVGIFSARLQPPYLAAFWRLSRGYLYTFMQDQVACGSDLDAALRLVVENVDVTESPSGLPMIAINPPVGGGDVREPDQRDAVTFWPADGRAWPDIRITRLPSWTASSRSSADSGGVVAARATSSSSHVEVLVTGPTSERPTVQTHAQQVLDSFR